MKYVLNMCQEQGMQQHVKYIFLFNVREQSATTGENIIQKYYVHNHTDILSTGMYLLQKI